MTTYTELFPSTTAEVVGGLELAPIAGGVRVRRLPAWTRPQISDVVGDFVISMTSGVRLEFRTAATEIELELSATAPTTPEGEPAAATVAVVTDDDEPRQHRIPDEVLSLIDPVRGVWRQGRPYAVRFADLPPVDKHVELWLPHATATDLHALRADAPIAPARADPRPRWLHHGSSISQGGEAATPLGTWPVVAARRAGVRVHNLGFSGNAVADPYVARTMRDLPADLITLEIGINVVNGDVMRRRTFGPAVHGFLDTLRERHPETPIVLLTPVPCPAVETLPGPTATSGTTTVSAGDPRQLALGALSLSGIRDELTRVVDVRDDPALTLFDGHLLLRPDEVDDLDDGLHPNAAALQRMGERFADLVLAPAFGVRVSRSAGRGTR